ncbi:hypothetical protein ACQPX6_24990 [Actinomycetospora sp. CA-101289]|uniref:hypothetical protein n=1 Tax=Actinomycetospora sp. CA-101289 TaxID=3239893 RepID=UPI003D993CAC
MSLLSNGTPPGFRNTINELHGGYRAQHVQHTGPDPLVDDTVTFPMVVPHLLRALVFIVLPAFITSVLLVFAAFFDLLVAAGNGFRGGGGGGFSAFAMVVGFGLFVLAIVVLFFPIKEPIAEYSQVVEGRASFQEPSYWWVMQTAQRHGMPFGLRAVRMQGQPVMMFIHGRLNAMLVVRPYGQHLYVGWTMWRARSTVVLIGHYLRDTFGRVSPAAQFASEMRATDARAMRELVHSLSREGVQAAISAHTMVAEENASPDQIHYDMANLQEFDPSGPGARYM